MYRKKQQQNRLDLKKKEKKIGRKTGSALVGITVPLTQETVLQARKSGRDMLYRVNGGYFYC